MISLCIDGAITPFIALYKDGKLIAFKSLPKTMQSAQLMPLIAQMVPDPALLSEIWCGTGPGSFMGSRAAQAIGRALAWSLKIPLRGFNSFLPFYPTTPGNHTLLVRATSHAFWEVRESLDAPISLTNEEVKNRYGTPLHEVSLVTDSGLISAELDPNRILYKVELNLN